MRLVSARETGWSSSPARESGSQSPFSASFGSGAGSDSFIFRIKDRIEEVRDLAARTRPQLDENQIYVDYGTYAKLRGKIRMAE